MYSWGKCRSEGRWEIRKKGRREGIERREGMIEKEGKGKGKAEKNKMKHILRHPDSGVVP